MNNANDGRKRNIPKTDVFGLKGSPEEVVTHARAKADAWAGDDITKQLVARSFRDDLDRQYQWLQDNIAKKIQSEEKFEQENDPDLKKSYQEEVFILDMHVKQLQEGFAAQVNQYANDMIERYHIVMEKSGKPVPEHENVRCESHGSAPTVAPTEGQSSTDDESGADAEVVQDNGEDPATTRAKQQRLLLLWHAAKCKYDRHHCPVTPHCDATRSIWDHISQCSNPHCEVEYCISSRYILSHYKNCKDKRCVVCGPVRRAIRQSNEQGSKQLVANSCSHMAATM